MEVKWCITMVLVVVKISITLMLVITVGIFNKLDNLMWCGGL